jgi:hypothetical protein
VEVARIKAITPNTGFPVFGLQELRGNLAFGSWRLDQPAAEFTEAKR